MVGAITKQERSRKERSIRAKSLLSDVNLLHSHSVHPLWRLCFDRQFLYCFQTRDVRPHEIENSTGEEEGEKEATNERIQRLWQSMDKLKDSKGLVPILELLVSNPN